MKPQIHLRLGLISFPIMIVLACLTVIGTPYLFVKIINLMIVVALSAGFGAFVRESFLQKQKQKERSTE
ncbi:hypothetical protein SD70_07720 [Gordoniibacillus kamchatkensis]|uniref:Uncharacterized protein n=1 Tax=Gordoniibacillus kamchatkensis TaxID=1590651 RepID=A0ABR5AK95_9BACL|nr:hypothetical protein [Paenibacillus sp. VKM B-2647]KIL41332.1 hypothetical protein SD70_07720 [Paenibacillus sp. VKM B-2647]